ncbi:MAG TPA: hypothetical protein VGD71_28775 [Kribbella sp.]
MSVTAPGHLGSLELEVVEVDGDEGDAVVGGAVRADAVDPVVVATLMPATSR